LRGVVDGPDLEKEENVSRSRWSSWLSAGGGVAWDKRA
jgi:hypothetical protein